MKSKILMLLLPLVFAMGTVGCGPDRTLEIPDKPVPQPKAMPAPATKAPPLPAAAKSLPTKRGR